MISFIRGTLTVNTQSALKKPTVTETHPNNTMLLAKRTIITILASEISNFGQI